MRCGKCNAYIPDLATITSCIECGTPLEESHQLRQDALHKKQLEEARVQEERSKSQKNYSYPEAILSSLYSKYLYRDVFRRWNGSGALYLAFITALWMVPVCIWLQIDFSQNFEQKLVPIIQQIPHATFDKGSFRYEGEDPLIIQVPDQRQAVCVFTRREGAHGSKMAPTPIIFTPSCVIIKNPSQQEIKVIGFSDKFTYTIDANIALYWTRQFMRWSFFILYPGVWFATWVMILLFVLFFAVIGKLIAWILRIPSSFQNIYRLSAVAFTPAILLFPATYISPLSEKIYSGFMWVGPIFFTALGLWFNRPPQKKKAVK